MMHMRTTVTLDPDVEALLRKHVRQSGEAFKQVLNNAVRAGLRIKKEGPRPFRPLTFDMGLPSIDLTKASSLSAGLEDEELIRQLRRVR
jgi:hypothetical protein